MLMIDIYILADNEVTLIAFESVVICFVLNNAYSSKIQKFIHVFQLKFQILLMFHQFTSKWHELKMIDIQDMLMCYRILPLAISLLKTWDTNACFSVLMIRFEVHRILINMQTVSDKTANLCQIPAKWIHSNKETNNHFHSCNCWYYDPENQSKINKNTVKLIVVVLITNFGYNRTILIDVLVNTLLFTFGWVHVSKQYQCKIRSII